MELSEVPQQRGKQPPRGHYELRQQVIRDRPVEGVYALDWVPDDGGRRHQELVIVTERLPMLAACVAAFLVEHELPFGARAQGELRRAGVPFPVLPTRPGPGDDPYDQGGA
jgi:hypothetical protein